MSEKIQCRTIQNEQNCGILSKKLSHCKWLGNDRKILYPFLEKIEKWIKEKHKTPSPNPDDMLSALCRLREIPDFIIVGQDPYPNGKATGIAFQTADNRPSRSLDMLARSLEMHSGCYPNIDKWVDEYGILMINAALCNFSDCKDGDIFRNWKPFVSTVLEIIKELNPNAVFLLMGKERTWKLLTGDDRIVRSFHPSCGWRAIKHAWEKVSKFTGKNLIGNLSKDPIKKEQANGTNPVRIA